jgi:undecaprenyl-diphosphatase
MDFSDSAPQTGGIPLVAGMITAFFTGLVTVKLMLKIVRKNRLFGFAAYTAILGILCITLGNR